MGRVLESSGGANGVGRKGQLLARHHDPICAQRGCFTPDAVRHRQTDDSGRRPRSDHLEGDLPKSSGPQGLGKTELVFHGNSEITGTS